MVALKRPRRNRRPVDPEGRMPLIEHIRELRGRLVKALLGLVAGAIVAAIFYDPIWEFLKQPYCQLPEANILKKGECSLVVNTVFAPFAVLLKVSFLFGAVVSSPIWLYQLWAFVTPGLFRNERRWTLAFMALAVPLFAAGAALAYLTMDKGLSLLLGFAPSGVIPLISLDKYLSFAMAMLVIFGFSFELPLFVVFLNLIGVLSHARVRQHRQMIIFLLFVFAAIATPSQDPFTMLALSLPMLVLFEAAELFIFLHDRRRPQPEDYSGLADDETSPLNLDGQRQSSAETRSAGD